jgi:hypothetical protein
MPSFPRALRLRLASSVNSTALPAASSTDAAPPWGDSMTSLLSDADCRFGTQAERYGNFTPPRQPCAKDVGTGNPGGSSPV